MSDLAAGLVRLRADLIAEGADWALVGGVAVSLRTEPRTTVDIDVVLWVATDRDADDLVRRPRERGYTDHPTEPFLVHRPTQRLLGLRLVTPQRPGVLVDLLVACCGIEREVVAAADEIEALPGLVLPVARLGHLIGLKLLAGRPTDETESSVSSQLPTKRSSMRRETHVP